MAVHHARYRVTNADVCTEPGEFIAPDHSCRMNFATRHKEGNDKIERALFESNHTTMLSRTESAQVGVLETLKNKQTGRFVTPIRADDNHQTKSPLGSTSEANTMNKKRRKNNDLRTETDEVTRLNQRLHQPESTKKQDPNTYSSMIQVGEGFYNQTRLIDDLIARTEEDIRQQRAIIEDKEER